MRIHLRRAKPVEIIAVLIIMFTISTLFQGVIPFSMNRVIVMAILFVIILTNTSNMHKKTIILYGYIFALLLFNVLVSTETGLALKDLIYFGTTMCILDFFSLSRIDDLSKVLTNNYQTLKKVLYFVYFITVISLLMPSNYNTAWGEGTYFIGFARDT